jgi:glycerate 2-kinase
MKCQRVLICPDKFKDAISAGDAARAIAAGVRDASPATQVVLCLMADGGEGSGELLAEAGDARVATVLDPLQRPRAARWWHVDSGEAIIEMAEASGLGLLSRDERNPLHTTSYGTGQLIRAALGEGASEITICVGGSATVDGGAACLQAIGVKVFEHDGGRITEPIRGGDLLRISRVEHIAASSTRFRVLTDVANPLVGPTGAARVFGPQKGADAAAVSRLERGLAHWADVLERCTATAVRDIAGGGAAGGIAAGLHAILGAQICGGADFIAEAVSLRQKMNDCDLCITGEGQIDSQTASGKVIHTVARIANAAAVPVVAFAGKCESTPHLENLNVIEITPAGTPLDQALRDCEWNLRKAVAEWFRDPSTRTGPI